MVTIRTKRAVTNIISTLLLQFITIVCGFIVPRLIIKNYGSSVNGLIASITQFLSYITLLEFGFGPVVKSVLYKPIAIKNKKQIEDILKSAEKFFRTIAYIFMAYIIVLCYILPNVLSNEFDRLFIVSLIIIISISSFAEYFFGITYRIYLQAEQKTYITSIIQVISVILNAVTIIILVYANASIQIIKVISSLIFVIRPTVLMIYVKKKYKINIGKSDSNYKIKQKWDCFAQHVASSIHSNTDIVIITIFTGTVEVSAYSVYFMIINSIRKIMSSFMGGVDALLGEIIVKEQKKELRNMFSTYEFFFQFITTVVFSATFVLIVPFVSVYTKGITDANYYRPTFAAFMVLAEYIWTIRLPYNELIKAAGHFKQTRLGAWVEAISNILISIILVWKLGIIGVAIGTLVAVGIRTIDFMCYASKHILEISIFYTIKRFLLSLLSFGLGVIIYKFIPQIEINSYIDWVIEAIVILVIAVVIIFIINMVFYKKEMINVVQSIKSIIKNVK